MNRRSFMAGFAGLPIVGLGTRMFGLPKPTAKSGITVHGPELIDIHDGHNKLRPTVSLRFKNVPLRSTEESPLWELMTRIRSVFGTVNRSDWHWYGDPNPLPCLRIELARTLIFTDFGISLSKNGLASVMCAFTRASSWKPWSGSHRPVDFETEILKALEGKGYRQRARGYRGRRL